MTTAQLIRKAMYGRMGNYYDTHATTFDAYVPLKTEIAGFFTKYALLLTKEIEQVKDLRPMKAEKQRLWREWVKDLVFIAESARGWAVRHNPDLVHSLTITERNFLKLKQDLAADTAKDLVAMLQVYVTSLAAYGITPDKLGELDEKIDTFRALLPDLKHAGRKKKDATADIAAIIDQIDEAVSVTGSLIAGKYGVSNPELVHEFGTMKKLDKAAYHHTALRITVFHEGTGDAFQGARAVIRELQRSALTNIFGKAEIVQFRAGSYHVDIMVGDVVKKTLVLTIASGKVLEIVEHI